MRVRAMLAGIVALVTVAIVGGCSAGSPGPSIGAPIILATVSPANVVTVAASSSTSTTVGAGFASIKVQLPIAVTGGGSTMTVSASSTVPSAFAPFTGGTPVAYVTLWPQAAMSFNLYPTFTLTLPAGSGITPTSTFAVAFISNDPKTGATSWQPSFIASGIVSGESVAFPGGTATPPVSLSAYDNYVFCIYQT
jgi:hypothetical protein